MQSNTYNDPATDRYNTAHGGDYDHDQSTVHSPTEYHEKYGAGAAGTTGTAPKRQGKLAQLFNICSANPLVTYGLRFWQFIFGVIALALAAHSLNKFYTSDTRMRLTSFTGALTLLYLFVLMLLAFVRPTLLMAGPILIMELLLMILWLCSFVGGTARFANVSCKRSYSGSNSYSPYSSYNDGGSGLDINQYSSSGRIKGCRSGKAACAFAAISFLLFAISSILLFWNVVRPLLRRRKRNALFQTGTASGVRLNKNGLAFSKHYDPGANDLEYGAGGAAVAAEPGAQGHAHTDSTGTYGTTNEPNAKAGTLGTSGTTGVAGIDETMGSTGATGITGGVGSTGVTGGTNDGYYGTNAPTEPGATHYRT